MKVNLCMNCHVVLPGDPGVHADHLLGSELDMPEHLWEDVSCRQGLLRGLARGYEPFYTEEDWEEVRSTTRLLLCSTCATIDVLPWTPFQAYVEDDDALNEALARHRTDGIPHTGSLATVSAATWEYNRAGILRELNEANNAVMTVVD